MLSTGQSGQLIQAGGDSDMLPVTRDAIRLTLSLSASFRFIFIAYNFSLTDMIEVVNTSYNSLIPVKGVRVSIN